MFGSMAPLVTDRRGRTHMDEGVEGVEGVSDFDPPWMVDFAG